MLTCCQIAVCNCETVDVLYAHEIQFVYIYSKKMSLFFSVFAVQCVSVFDKLIKYHWTPLVCSSAAREYRRLRHLLVCGETFTH